MTMYQERQANEHALRTLRLRPMWVMIISTISDGGREAVSCAVCVSGGPSGGALPRRRLILALPRSKTILIRVARFLPAVRMAQRLEPRTRTSGQPYLVPRTSAPLNELRLRLLETLWW